MMKFKKAKSAIIGLTLTLPVGLTACTPKEKEQKNESTSQTQTIEKNVKTEAKTEQNTTEAIKVDEKEINFYNLAAESYNNYSEFYANAEMAYADENAKDGINITRIENMIKVINGEVSTLTPDEVKNAKEDIGYVLLSQELSKDLNRIANRNLGYITIEGEMKLSEAPKISGYTKTKEVREITEKYEKLRDKVIDDINNTQDIKEETKEELRQAVIEMKKNQIEQSDAMSYDPTSEGGLILESMDNFSLVQLTVGSTNEPIIKTDEFPGGKIKLIAETDEERDIEAKVLDAGIESLNDKEKAIYTELKLTALSYLYEAYICGHLQNLIDHANSKTDVHSKIEKYKKMKKILEAVNNDSNINGYELTYTI